MVDDVEHTAKRLAENGLTVSGVTQTGWGSRAIQVRDPDGLGVHFFQPDA